MSASDRPGCQFWQPYEIFPGRTAFLLGGGPSLTAGQVERIRGHGVVFAINSSAKLCPWADVLYFTDCNWFEDNRALVMDWPGIVVTASRLAKAEAPDRLLRVDLDERPDFAGPGLKCGRSSGHIALSLAIALGCKRVVLLGYDMRIVDGRSHFHTEYPTQDDKMYAQEFVRGFSRWNAAAERAGVEVLNATPGSALLEFPMVTLDEVLGGGDGG